MTPQNVVNNLIEKFPALMAQTRFHNQIEVRVYQENIINVLSALQSMGFEFLCEVTCVDWPSEDRIDVTYNLWSYEHHVHATVKVAVKRDHPEITTVMSLWPQAQAYEQIAHEMFGVVFRGNPDLSPLILHNWQDIPPLRKDFDTEAYARKAYE